MSVCSPLPVHADKPDYSWVNFRVSGPLGFAFMETCGRVGVYMYRH